MWSRQPAPSSQNTHSDSPLGCHVPATELHDRAAASWQSQPRWGGACQRHWAQWVLSVASLSLLFHFLLKNGIERSWALCPISHVSIHVDLIEHTLFLPPEGWTLAPSFLHSCFFQAVSSVISLVCPWSKSSSSLDFAGGDTAKCRVEAQRFKHGSYTLLHDTDPHVGEMALDVVFFIAGEGKFFKWKNFWQAFFFVPKLGLLGQAHIAMGRILCVRLFRGFPTRMVYLKHDI